MTKITFGGNFFIGGKSAELHPFSTVSQVTCNPSISLFAPIFLPTGPFPCLEVVCSFGLGFSVNAPRLGCAGLGLIGCRLTKEGYANHLRKIAFLPKFVLSRFALKSRSYLQLIGISIITLIRKKKELVR